MPTEWVFKIRNEPLQEALARQLGIGPLTAQILVNRGISSPEEAFYKWDRAIRFIPEWNKDMTLKEAFRVSCVPAFQNLARKIGPERMQLRTS